MSGGFDINHMLSSVQNRLKTNVTVYIAVKREEEKKPQLSLESNKQKQIAKIRPKR